MAGESAMPGGTTSTSRSARVAMVRDEPVAEGLAARRGTRRCRGPYHAPGRGGSEPWRCARCGEPPGPGVHPGQPLAADGASGVAIHRSPRRSRAEDRRAGERVVPVQDDVGRVPGDDRRRQVVGDVDREVAPAVDDAEVGLAGRHEVDGVPGLRLGEAEGQGRDAPRRSRTTGATSPRIAVEKRGEAQVARDRTGPLVQGRLDLPEVGEEPGRRRRRGAGRGR